MSATQEWIKEQLAKEPKPYTVQQQLDELALRVKALEEEIAWKERSNEHRADGIL